MFVTFLQATPAQAATAYVSATGLDTNTCLSEAQACLTLDKAITVSSPSGKILIVGHGDFQGLTGPIVGGLSIIAPDGGVSIKQDSLSQPVFTINAGTTDTVTLKNLGINGGNAGTIGIQVNNGGKVFVENCTLKGFSNGEGEAMFLQPNPGAGVQSQLYISNTEVSNATTGLILIAPRSGLVKTYFTHVEVHNSSGFGIKSDGTNGSVDNAITDSAFFSVTGSAIHGLTPPTGSPGAPVVRVSLERTTVLNSGGGAVVGNGGGSKMLVNKSTVIAHALGIYALNGGTVVLEDSIVSGNGVGVSLSASSPVISYGNNVISANSLAQCGDDVCNGASPGTLSTGTHR
jgi:hypothetical protein